MMRWWMVVLAVLAVAGCKKAKGQDAGEGPGGVAEVAPLPPPPVVDAAAEQEAQAASPAADAAAPEASAQEGTMDLKARPDVADRVARYARMTLGAEDVAKLGETERAVLHELRRAADLMGEIAFRQTWTGNAAMRDALAKITDESYVPAKELFRIMGGPWDRQDDYLPFLGATPHPKGSAFYPEDLTKEELESWVSAHPEQAEAFKGFFTTVERRDGGLAAVPYSEAYKEFLEPAAEALRAAAALATTPELASLKKYLEARAAAFLSNDYYASDLDWLDLGGPLEVVFGPYETYDDGLMGYKASFESFLCVVDPAESETLAKYKGEVPFLESSLPIPDEHKNPNRGTTVPITVVDEVYATGQAGIMTIAFNLPNDERVREAKGFKNVLLRNVMLAKYDAILVPIAERVLPADLAMALSPDAFVNFVLFHELSHGLGPGKIRKNGVETEVRTELRELYPTLEEAKADILSLFVQKLLADKGVLPAEQMATVPQTFVAGIFRTARFGVSEAHGQGVLLQVNYLMEKGAIVVTPEGKFAPVAEKFFDAVRDLAHDLLMLQATGDYDGAKAFLEKYGKAVPEAMHPLIESLGGGLPVDITPQYAEF
ncbi:MAG: peptidase [Deltaproteobacteria bacterium]|nr:peptidase [Deltaproteobacteria bacterium]